MAGRPPGVQNKDKPYRDALRRAIARAEQNKNDPHALDRIAEKHLARAAAGDVQAIKELADRLDGKPAQSIIGGDDDDPAVKLITRVEIVPGVNGQG
jgi:hypothetical protein